jgi:hypothetical protein
MGKSFFFLFPAILLGAGSLSAQVKGNPPADSVALPIPGKESFINEVFRSIVDSSFSSYYLCEDAYPCSFVKYDYDEWFKYALFEMVPIGTLNELAKKSYYDRVPASWLPALLTAARCVSEKRAGTLLDPLADLPPDTALTKFRLKKLKKRRWQAWSALPPGERTVFYFSRPLFTDDGHYALLDMDYRCDARQCGVGAVCLFRRTASGWKLIGKRVRWGE